MSKVKLLIPVTVTFTSILSVSGSSGVVGDVTVTLVPVVNLDVDSVGMLLWGLVLGSVDVVRTVFVIESGGVVESLNVVVPVFV